MANQVKKNGREKLRSAKMNCVNSLEATHSTQTSTNRIEPMARFENEPSIARVNLER